MHLIVVVKSLLTISQMFHPVPTCIRYTAGIDSVTCCLAPSVRRISSSSHGTGLLATLPSGLGVGHTNRSELDAVATCLPRMESFRVFHHQLGSRRRTSQAVALKPVPACRDSFRYFSIILQRASYWSLRCVICYSPTLCTFIPSTLAQKYQLCTWLSAFRH
jgi:hypothetical protein